MGCRWSNIATIVNKTNTSYMVIVTQYDMMAQTFNKNINHQILFVGANSDTMFLKYRDTPTYVSMYDFINSKIVHHNEMKNRKLTLKDSMNISDVLLEDNIIRASEIHKYLCVI